MTKLLPVVICSRRNTAEDWADLDLTVRSILYYTDADVFVYWKQNDNGDGPQFFDLFQEPRCHFRRQASHLQTFGAAYSWAIQQTIAECPQLANIVIANDDIVLQPDTWQLLADDVQFLVSQNKMPGIVASRSNYIRRVQKAYGTAEDLLECDAVSPVFAWLNLEASARLVWPDCNWFSDDIICHDLRQLGYKIFVSRSYVHHIGERSTRANGENQTELHRSGLHWLVTNRPDVAETLRNN